MMITLQELCDELNKTLQTEGFEDYCPNGLQVEGKPKIKKVGTAVSATLETIAAAVACGCDALVVHHGLFWNRDPYPIVGSKKKKIELLFDEGLSLLAYHLPLDAHPVIGNNWKAAKDLQLKKCKPFCKFGVIGEISVETGQFIEQVERYYDHPATTALGGPKKIKRVAILSGGGYKYLQAAKEAGADCFITGNFDEPVYPTAFEEEIHFLALGHNATERVGPKEVAKFLARKLRIKTEFIDIFNPF